MKTRKHTEVIRPPRFLVTFEIYSHEKMKCHFLLKMSLQTLGPKTVGGVLLGTEHQTCNQSMQLV